MNHDNILSEARKLRTKKVIMVAVGLFLQLLLGSATAVALLGGNKKIALCILVLFIINHCTFKVCFSGLVRYENELEKTVRQINKKGDKSG